MSLENKTAIITGANQGLGFAIAKAFLGQKANVVICARDTVKLKVAHEQLSASANGERLLSVQADISKAADNARVAAAAIEKFGTIDILIANAGVYGPKGKIEETDWQEWSDAIDINLKGTVLSCISVIPEMKKKGKGKIIILSGGGATKPMPFLSSYAASKAAVVRFAETLAEELKEYHIDVNSVAPGALNTRLLEEVLAAGAEKVGQTFYEQSLKQKENGGAPLEKGSSLCMYLAGDESDGITGKLISAVWDPWQTFAQHKKELVETDVFTLRRIIPEERDLTL